MHTNFDKTHLNRYVFEQILGFEVSNQSDFLCSADGEWNLYELIDSIKERLDLQNIRVVAPKEKIKSISLCTGAGASLIDNVITDCLLTGDIKYHDAMKAKSQKLMLIDIGHYESEKFFAEILNEKLKLLPLLAIMTNSKNPFQNITPKG
jgi:putative NIF3 family GTP cyclohydrolase 1 type 2